MATPHAARKTGDDAALAERRLRAIEVFDAARAAAEQAAETVTRTREQRMDRDRRMEVLRREHEALLRRAEAQLAASGELLRSSVPVRAVVAHRRAWFTDRLVTLLGQQGILVIEQVDNGADAIGLAVAEQPDYLFVEDGLLMVPGEQVVREAREFCSDTRIGAQASGPERIGVLLDAGAHSVCTRRLPPDQYVQQVLAS